MPRTVHKAWPGKRLLGSREAGTPTIAYLGVLASLQLVDPTVANTALVQAGRSLGMEDATLTLAASVSTLAQVPLLVCFGAGGVLAGSLLLVGLGLAFVAVPQSALFVQEAPERCFGAVTAFRTTTGQLGFASGFAVSGALVHGFGLADLRQRLLAQGIPATALPALLERGRSFLNHGLPAGAPLPPPVGLVGRGTGPRASAEGG